MDSSVYQCSNFPYYKCDAQPEGEIYEKWTYQIVVENVRHPRPAIVGWVNNEEISELRPQTLQQIGVKTNW